MNPATAPAGANGVRGLTVKQPWAWALCHGKPVENRSWPVPHKLIGNAVLLHAGQGVDRAAFEDPRILNLPGLPGRRDLAAGAVLATARLAGCHRETDGCCVPWGDRGAFHWELADLTVLAEPVPCKGALSLWTPASEVITRVTCMTKEGPGGQEQQD